MMSQVNTGKDSVKGERRTRNPFGVMDVPDPDDRDVAEFAAHAHLSGDADDHNAADWGEHGSRESYDTIDGTWSSRWNGGADPTIPNDAADKWKQGHSETRTVGDRVYILFDWDRGARKGLIDARRDGVQRLIGKYVNISDPAIIRPWVGLIVNNRRLDGRWSGGRLDFRR
jgi:hypothetical protein